MGASAQLPCQARGESHFHILNTWGQARGQRFVDCTGQEHLYAHYLCARSNNQTMTSLRTWFRRWGPALLMMALIFGASSTPGNDLPEFGLWDFLVKKGGHMLGYALLAASCLRGLAISRGMSRRMLFLAVIMAGLYAVTDEFHQSFTPGRTPSPTDVGIDTLGAAVGAGVCVWIRSAKERPS